MKQNLFRMLSALIVLSLTALACSFGKSVPSLNPSSFSNDGVKIVTGDVTYTNAYFTEGVAQPIVILEDQGGFVTRNRDFLIPVESQVIGQITSDFYTSPFTYSLTLPSEPRGTFNDVDHDGVDEAGVMVFAVAYWTNTWGDPYLERRDQGGGGWSSAYASTKISDDRDSYLEVYGGKYLVYAPDENQSFPSNFGNDKKLFTDDDPIMDLPAGWSVIDLDRSPFSLDQSEEVNIPLLEPEGSALDDFSSMSYTDAFDAMLEKFRNEYAFTEFKNIDWDAKEAEFRPLFEAAEKNRDKHAFALALRDFLWSIPDTHIGFDMSALSSDFQLDVAGGLGFAMTETDDGKFIATYITDGGPADQAGMVWGAEIVSMDDVPMTEVVQNVSPWSSPFSNPEIQRLEQLRFATRFNPAISDVKVTFKNPSGSERTVTMKVENEFDSFNVPLSQGEDPTALPVEFSMLPNGYGYVKISSFLDNDVLSIQVWERAMHFFNDNNVPGIILDMRNNGGGSGWLANQMAAYFFSEETVVGRSAYYDDSIGEFYVDPESDSIMIPPASDLQYKGRVVVMVGPDCASACEFFSYNMTVNDRALIVGEYPSEGAGGSVEIFLMPEQTLVQMTIGRAMDADGNIHIEGSGVVPDILVPVTFETLQLEHNGEDVVLKNAIGEITQK